MPEDLCDFDFASSEVKINKQKNDGVGEEGDFLSWRKTLIQKSSLPSTPRDLVQPGW